MISLITTGSGRVEQTYLFSYSATFRHCHRDAFDKLKSIGDEIVRSHAYNIAKAAKLI